MATKLRIITYNCQSFRANKQFIKTLLQKCDILLLQETLLTEHNANELDTLVDNDFIFCHTPAVTNGNFLTGRPSSGLAIYWKAMDNFKCYPIMYTDRLMALRLENSTYKCVLLNVYLNCDYRTTESLHEYQSNIGDISNFIREETFDDLVIAGDWNCHPNRGRFFHEFLNLTNEHALTKADLDNLPPFSYTYISSNNSAGCSWLDHVACSRPTIVSNFNIMYGSTFQDHIPLCFELCLPHIPNFSDCELKFDNNLNILWDNVTDEQLDVYSDTLEDLSVELWVDALSCSSNDCDSDAHIAQLDLLYNSLLECIKIASDHLPRVKKRHHKRIVGWNQYCKHLYAEARSKFFAWHDTGKPRNGDIFEAMKTSRLDFKNALKFCKNNELYLKKQILLSRFNAKNSKSFWNEVRKIKGKVTNSKCIDGTSDTSEIVNIFNIKYRETLDNLECQSTEPINQSDGNSLPLLFTMRELGKAINRLNPGKGFDHIHTKHLKHTKPCFRNLLCKLINKFVTHGFIPQSMLKGEIRPTVKNGAGSKTSSQNYRPVMTSSNCLKVFEYLLLPYLEKHLNVHSNQFAYRRSTSCLQAITLLKETITHYNSRASNVHCAMVDLSKAYDRVNISILCRKLRETTLPVKIINILQYMGFHTSVATTFGGHISDPWNAKNGVRQGGVCSGILFNFYLNEVLTTISHLPVGCSLNGVRMNILCYADDIVIIAPSAMALQHMLDRLAELIDNLSLKINVNKSCHIVFKEKCKKAVSNLTLNNEPLKTVTECKYLGVVLADDLSCTKDVERAKMSFFKQFNSLYCKFSCMDQKVLLHLFKMHAMCFYGVESWFIKLYKKDLNNISIPYHKAIKRACKRNVYDSNHECLEMANLPIFKHLVAKRLISFAFSIGDTDSPCLANHKPYLRFQSTFSREIKKLFSQDYQIHDVFDNPLCAVNARIDYVQRTEPRSMGFEPG